MNHGNSIKPKAPSFIWAFMFALSIFQTDEIEKQHELLNRVSELIDYGTLISIVTHNPGKISLETLKEAHVNRRAAVSSVRTCPTVFSRPAERRVARRRR